MAAPSLEAARYRAGASRLEGARYRASRRACTRSARRSNCPNLPVFAVDAPERVGHFANRRIGLDSLNNVRHQIRGTTRRILQTFNGRMRSAYVACRAREREIFDLSSFDCRISSVDRHLMLLIDS